MVPGRTVCDESEHYKYGFEVSPVALDPHDALSFDRTVGSSVVAPKPTAELIGVLYRRNAEARLGALG